MRPSPARPLVRHQVRSLLEGSAAWAALPTDERRALAHGLVRIGEYLAEPAWLTSPNAPGPVDALRRQVLPPRAVGLSSTFHEGATRDAGSTFGDLTGSVDFPAFVASLVKGVFQAIVDASIQQMQAYQELIGNLVQSLSQFERTVSDGEVGDYLQNRFPGNFSMNDGSLDVLGSGPDASMGSELGLSSDFQFTNTNRDLILQAGRQKLARQRQQMLATMALMGIDRIVVTDGRINARVLFDMHATDTANQSRTSSYQHSDAKHIQTSHHSFWGTSRSSTTEDIKTTVRSATSATSKETLQLHASLSGDVGINFKSQTVDLDKLVAGPDLESIKKTATPQPLRG